MPESSEQKNTPLRKNLTFKQINEGWNAEPNAPYPSVKMIRNDVLLTFLVNAFQFNEFKERELGILRFADCEKLRFGPTDDYGWYRGQCRFSKLAPAWGEFYLVSGDPDLLNAPKDWKVLGTSRDDGKHFLFYFRDVTFECVANTCLIENVANNALKRISLPENV